MLSVMFTVLALCQRLSPWRVTQWYPVTERRRSSSSRLGD